MQTLRCFLRLPPLRAAPAQAQAEDARRSVQRQARTTQVGVAPGTSAWASGASWSPLAALSRAQTPVGAVRTLDESLRNRGSEPEVPSQGTSTGPQARQFVATGDGPRPRCCDCPKASAR